MHLKEIFKFVFRYTELETYVRKQQCNASGVKLFMMTPKIMGPLLADVIE